MMNNMNIIGCDTDSFIVNKPDQSPWQKEEVDAFIKYINAGFPDLISWEFDGLFPKILVLKSKNYVLVDELNKIKIKGSALKDAKKPKIFLEFIKDIIDYLLNDRQSELQSLYASYIMKTYKITEIKPWCKKTTITDKILKCDGYEYMSEEEIKEKKLRANEWKVWDAIRGKNVQEGDKIYVFFKQNGELCLDENWSGDYDQVRLIKNLHDCLKIFKNIIDINMFPNYALKKNKELLDKLACY
jgi:DNA polymerase elongation subunit (family B)